jgi:glycerol-3-phosphate dehydrogenase
VEEVLGRSGAEAPGRLRLVRGSHIAVPALWEGDHAYILQQPDGRVVFALPYRGGLTVIGTTDVPVETGEEPRIDAEETRYLCDAADRYFRREVKPSDVVWSWSGVRALYDDGAAEAQAVTRDWHLELDEGGGAKLLSVFGGKLTTARALAQQVLDRLGVEGRRSTGWMALPGGDLTPAFLAWLEEVGEWMPQPLSPASPTPTARGCAT